MRQATCRSTPAARPWRRPSGPSQLDRLRIPDEALKRTLALVRDELWEKSRRASTILTARERELLTDFAGGAPYARIAAAKGISPVTVRNTISRVQDKLGLDTKQELVIWAVKNGLVQERETPGVG